MFFKFINNILCSKKVDNQTKLAIISILVMIPLVSIIVYGTGSNFENNEIDDSKLKVISSFYPLHEFSENIGHDKIEATLLVPVGIEPHDWEPTIKDIQKIQSSDLVIINGLGFETWVDKIGDIDYSGSVVDTSFGISIESIEDEYEEHTDQLLHEISEIIEEFEHGHFTQNQTIKLIEEILHEHEDDDHNHDSAIIEEIKTLLSEIKDGHIGGPQRFEEIHHLISIQDGHKEKGNHADHGHSHEEGDPHIWLNPNFAKIQVQNIANSFSNHDPKNSEFYQSNASAYIEQLDLLDFKIKNELSGCKQDFIAFHDAFSYFADEYSLNQHSIIPTNNSHGEATAKTLETVISTAKELDIKVIFAEEQTDSRTSKVIADEIGGKVLVLSPLEVVSDGNYISKMTENLKNLKEALC